MREIDIQPFLCPMDTEAKIMEIFEKAAKNNIAFVVLGWFSLKMVRSK